VQGEKDNGSFVLPQDVADVVAGGERRAVLHALGALDSPPDADFDNLATLAATIAGAPVGLVTLVDETRQWFRAAHGTDVRETPVEISFCAHAIAAGDDATVITDMTGDPRFAGNPLVTGEEHIRFYAGFPMTVAGARIGSVCVLDRVARKRPTPEQMEQLKSLAAIGGSLLALKESTRKGELASVALGREEKRHKLALEAASIASWVWDVRTDIVECDALLPVLFNLPHARRFTAKELFLAIDRRDITETERRLSEALRPTDDYQAQYRVAGTNPPRWLMARGRVVERDAAGDPMLVFGVHFDISDTKVAEERQRLLLRELNHRVKNTLATVQALASQTVRHAADPRAFLNAFSGRLQALGVAHGVLSDREWRGIGLAELVRIEVKPFDDPEQPRVVATGPDIWLSADQSLALGLVLHELASNALKYGSLSLPQGRVELTWRIDAISTPSRIVLSWREEGGPPVTPPEREGFGSILIRRSLGKILSSSVTHEYRPEGVVAEISMALDDSAE
jgi:two-component sensor histidine kinase